MAFQSKSTSLLLSIHEILINLSNVNLIDDDDA